MSGFVGSPRLDNCQFRFGESTNVSSLNGCGLTSLDNVFGSHYSHPNNPNYKLFSLRVANNETYSSNYFSVLSFMLYKIYLSVLVCAFVSQSREHHRKKGIFMLDRELLKGA